MDHNVRKADRYGTAVAFTKKFPRPYRADHTWRIEDELLAKSAGQCCPRRHHPMQCFKRDQTQSLLVPWSLLLERN